MKYFLKDFAWVMICILLWPILIGCAILHTLWVFLVGGWRAISEEEI